jgi:hypothetical protein
MELEAVIDAMLHLGIEDKDPKHLIGMRFGQDPVRPTRRIFPIPK